MLKKWRHSLSNKTDIWFYNTLIDKILCIIVIQFHELLEMLNKAVLDGDVCHSRGVLSEVYFFFYIIFLNSYLFIKFVYIYLYIFSFFIGCWPDDRYFNFISVLIRSLICNYYIIEIYIYFYFPIIYNDTSLKLFFLPIWI